MTLSELNRHEGLTHDVHSYICSLMEGDETQHDTRPHICFFGLYTCVIVRLFSLCASFVTFWACYIDSDYSCCCIIFCTRLGFQVIVRIVMKSLRKYQDTFSWITEAQCERTQHCTKDWNISDDSCSSQMKKYWKSRMTLRSSYPGACTSWAIHTFPAGHHEEARVKRHQITNYAFHHWY